MKNLIEQNSKSDVNKNFFKRIVRVLLLYFIFLIILFAGSGHLDWLWAWIYLIIYIVHIIVNMIILPEELIAERGKSKDNVKKWDKVLTKLSIIPGLGLLLIAGLDERFMWTPELNPSIHLVGLFMYIIGNIILSWSMLSNKFFSTLVRIQDDRAHKVATSGPYQYVRHPGYVGFIISTLFLPFLLGSLWALIPALLLAILFIIRTFYEDKTLQMELEGYKEFVEKVHYRLIPGFW